MSNGVRDDPVFSIVVPVYNMASFVGDCLRSILKQDYPHIQLIVIDGGSKDGSKEVIRQFANKLFYWCSERDDGQTDALNKGFSRATGDIYCWLNADEEYSPDALRAVADAFRKGPNVDLVYGNRVDCDQNGSPIQTVRRPRMHPKNFTLHCGGVLPTDATFWSARAHKATGELDHQRFPHLAMDYDWFMRLSFHVDDWVYLDRAIGLFKHHANRQTRPEYRDEVQALWSLARARCIQEKNVSAMELVLGWFCWGAWARIQSKNLRLPRISTLLRILGSERRRTS